MKYLSLFLMTVVLAACGGGSSSHEETASTEQHTSSGGTAEPAHVHLSVQNSSQHEICFLYISPVESTHWGDDVLGHRTLSPGETDAYDLEAGHWDIKADNCDHQELFVMHNALIDDHTVLTLHD